MDGNETNHVIVMLGQPATHIRNWIIQFTNGMDTICWWVILVRLDYLRFGWTKLGDVILDKVGLGKGKLG